MKGVLPEGVLKAVRQIRGGVFPEHSKLTKDMPAERIAPPEKVVLPMQQHIGAPCEPCVKVGERVLVGQLIGDSPAFISAPIHASISGKVISVSEAKVANGKAVQAVTIENDGLMECADFSSPVKADSRQELIAAVRRSGLVGLGGAGFPTHAKLSFPEGKADTLIINAAECEPYITVDYRECLDNSWDVISGIHILAELLGFKSVVIAVEDNKPQAIKVLKSIADKGGCAARVSVMALKSKYPQGAEKMMVRSATGRRVPLGKLPADVGCVVMNIASVAFIARYLKTGKPLVSRSLTVGGSAVAEPKNVRAPIGTLVSDLIDFCGGFKAEPKKIIAGGPMMGAAVIGTDIPIVKANNAVLAFADGRGLSKKQTACIHCGRCADVCPMSLVPTDIEKYALSGDSASLVKSGVAACMECGSCAFACPAAKPLVQYMRLGKQVVREAEGKK